MHFEYHWIFVDLDSLKVNWLLTEQMTHSGFYSCLGACSPKVDQTGSHKSSKEGAHLLL
jgi:hypothetical protein